MKIILAGGSGFLGRTLAAWFRERGHNPVVISRSSPVSWDGQTLGPWASELDGADAVINLAGRSVNCRYTAEHRREMIESRVLSTRVLGDAIRACKTPPRVWLNSSTATIYRHTLGAAHDESGEVAATPEAKDAFSIDVARAWEEEFAKAVTPATRKVVLRTAMVFGPEPGGVFQVLRRLTRVCLGGAMAGGDQFVSWIHAGDFCRAIDWLIAQPESAGIYNVCAPVPVTNHAMMAAFRHTYGRCIGLPASRWMMEVGAFLLRTETELVIKSRRVIPARLLREGFVFRHPTLESALHDLLGTRAA